MDPIATNKRIFDSVYGTLRDAILSRELKSGEQLSVPDLARRLGVSRSPVREAVLQLVADGLAASEPRKGAAVAGPDGNSLLALHDIRELLEGLAARRAALSITKNELADLKRILDEQKSAVTRNDIALYKQTDQAFHRRLVDISAESQLQNMLRMLRDQMRLAVDLALADPTHVKKGHAEHVAVLRALSHGSPADAERCMRAHIAASRSRVDATFRKSAAKAQAAVTDRPAARRSRAPR